MIDFLPYGGGAHLVAPGLLTEDSLPFAAPHMPAAAPGAHLLQSVLVVDGDPQSAERTRRLLRAIVPTCRVSVVADAHEALQLLLLPLRLALIDTDLPGGQGLALIRHLRTAYPQIESVAVSSCSDDAAIVSAVSAGALGYLLKETDETDLSFLLRSVIRGGAPIDPRVARRMLRLVIGGMPVPAPVPAPMAGDTVSARAAKELLSPRELRILRLIAQGWSNRQIAESVYVSINTIEFHAKSIYRKLSVKSRTQAVHKAQQSGLLR